MFTKLYYFKGMCIITGFALGFIYSIGLFSLFYKFNRPNGRFRQIALLILVIIIRPLISLRDSRHFFSQDIQNIGIVENSFFKMIFWLAFEAIVLLIFLFLGNKRLRMLVPAAFVLCINISVIIPIYYIIAASVYPLIETKNIYEIAYQFPNIYFIIIFSVNFIITCCCLTITRWLRNTESNPPFKLYSIFSLLFIVFSLIVTIWWTDIRKNISISYLTTAFMGILLLVILLFIFYIYSKLISKNINVNNTANELNNKSQIIQKLSKRELDVIRTVLMGNNTYKEISDKLNISVNTVKFHLKRIYKTTEVSGISDLQSFFRGMDLNP